MKHLRRTDVAAVAIAALLLLSSWSPSVRAVADSKFIRFVPDDKGGGTLDCSIVTYRNNDGVTVDLIGAVHVADKSFYDDLNKRFEQYDSLLYEMVKPKDADLAPAPGAPRGPGAAPRRRAPRGLGWVGSLQRILKETLDLTFQLEEINYSRPNFVHADLDSETFQRKQAERGESLLTMMLQAMFQDMKRETPAVAEPGIMDLVEALQSPDRSRRLKLLLAQQFANMDVMVAMLEGPNGSVILTERNKAALNVLTKRIAAGDQKVGIFYGAAHLSGMEKMLILDLGFKQVGEPVWITAWDMTK